MSTGTVELTRFDGRRYGLRCCGVVSSLVSSGCPLPCKRRSTSWSRIQAFEPRWTSQISRLSSTMSARAEFASLVPGPRILSTLLFLPPNGFAPRMMAESLNLRDSQRIWRIRGVSFVTNRRRSSAAHDREESAETAQPTRTEPTPPHVAVTAATYWRAEVRQSPNRDSSDNASRTGNYRYLMV